MPSGPKISRKKIRLSCPKLLKGRELKKTKSRNISDHFNKAFILYKPSGFKTSEVKPSVTTKVVLTVKALVSKFYGTELF